MTTSSPIPAAQPILEPVPDHARYMEFVLRPDADPVPVLRALAGLGDPALLVGLGAGLVAGLGAVIEGLHGFRALSGPGVNVPATQADVLCRLHGSDRGDIAGRARHLRALLAPAFEPVRQTDAFRHRDGRDLSGYEDGTENPEGEEALRTALIGSGPLAGSGFVTVQKWRHDLDHFETLPQQLRDHIIGRRLSDNAELDDAPASAHVKRTAQESFSPEAFMLRRSMPWADAEGEGLMFTAFAASLYPFEVQMARMSGLDDGITDGLFRFSRPLGGAHYWCPPRAGAGLDLRALGL